MARGLPPVLKSGMPEISANSPEPRGKHAWKAVLPILIVVFTSIAVYSNSLNNGFVWDDHSVILKNQWIKTPRSLPEIFSSDEWAFIGHKTNFYRPMVHVAYMAVYAIFRLRPWGYHLANILLHSANSALVFLLALYFLEATVPALIAALLFATHPVHTEAVAWVSVTCDLMCTFFILLALFMFINGKNRFLSAIFFLLALLSKEIAFCFPLIAFICPPYGKNNSIRDRLKWTIPFIAAAIVYLGLRTFALGSFVRVNWRPELTHWQVFINSFALFGAYLFKFILPLGLHAEYQFSPAVSMLDWRVIAGCLALVLFIAAVITYSRMMLVPGAIFIFTLLPVLCLTVIPAESVLADRYAYLPSVGFFIIIAGWIWRLCIWKPAAKTALTPLAAGLLVFYCAGTFTHNRVWKSDFTLWSDAVKKSPNRMAFHNLNTIYIGQGRYDEAIGNMQTALSAFPKDPEVYYDLADIYAMSGRPEAALATVERVKQMALPEDANYSFHMADALRTNGRLDDAVAEYKKAIQMDPQLTFAYHNLNTIYVRQGKIGDAIDNLHDAIRANPDEPKLHYDLAKIYAISNRPEDAMNALDVAEKMRPDASVYKKIGDFFLRHGQREWAEQAFNKAAGLGAVTTSASEWGNTPEDQQ